MRSRHLHRSQGGWQGSCAFSGHPNSSSCLHQQFMIWSGSWSPSCHILSIHGTISRREPGRWDGASSAWLASSKSSFWRSHMIGCINSQVRSKPHGHTYLQGKLGTLPPWLKLGQGCLAWTVTVWPLTSLYNHYLIPFNKINLDKVLMNYEKKMKT